MLDFEIIVHVKFKEKVVEDLKNDIANELLSLIEDKFMYSYLEGDCEDNSSEQIFSCLIDDFRICLENTNRKIILSLEFDENEAGIKNVTVDESRDFINSLKAYLDKKLKSYLNLHSIDEIEEISLTQDEKIIEEE